MEAFERKDYTTSLREWEPLAQKGDAKAQFLVGSLYYYGQGVPQDYQQASKWLRLAGEQGVTLAQYMLGGLSLAGLGVPKDANQARMWYRLAADQGSVEAQFASFDGSKLTVRDEVVKASRGGDAAWFSEVVDWDTKAGGQPVSLKGCRFTGVLEKRDGAWKVVQFHASMPVQGQAAQY